MWASGTSQPVSVPNPDDCTFLGKDVVFKGVLTLEGNIRVDGRLEGELRSTGTLIIGEHAVIRGNIMAGILITSGNINGNVIASEKIKILKPGIVIGDIRTPAISIESGARFHGLSDMGTDRRIEARMTTHENVLDVSVHHENLRKAYLGRLSSSSTNCLGSITGTTIPMGSPRLMVVGFVSCNKKLAAKAS